MIKTEYFKINSIDSEAHSIQNQLNNMDLFKGRELELQSPALLVLDMQNYFTSVDSHAYVQSSKAIIPKIQMLISEFKTRDLPVIFTKHSNNTRNADRMSKRWKELMPETGKLFEICDELAESASHTIHKHQYDAFYETDLQELLDYINVKSLIIAGLVANLCVETTARSGFVRGFNPIVPVDATATHNLDLHIASMANICFAINETPISEYIINKLKSSK